MTSNKVLALLPVALLLGLQAAHAGDAPPEFGRYLPKYPAVYYTLGYSHDARDSSFDRDGKDRGSAVPTVPGETSFPESRIEGSYSSYFPMFEDEGIPWLSNTIHTMRIRVGYGETETRGTLTDYIATNPEFAPRSQGGDHGIRDVGFEFGSFLYGANDWRTRKDTPLAVLALVGLDAGVGNYEQTSPVTQSSNHYTWSATVGAHWRPWAGGFVEGGAGARWYEVNENAHFGRMSPTQQGRDLLWDASLTQKAFDGGFVGVFLTGRNGAANLYREPKYAANAPEPNPAPEGGTTESFPISGNYRDGGTSLLTAGLSFTWFATQRLGLTLDYSHPLAGKSGQPVVEFRQRQCPAGSQPGSSSCTEADQGPVVVDGQGSARSFSSDQLRFAISYNFGHSDLYSCTGCER